MLTVLIITLKEQESGFLTASEYVSNVLRTPVTSFAVLLYMCSQKCIEIEHNTLQHGCHEQINLENNTRDGFHC